MKFKNVKHGQRVVLKVDTECAKAGDAGTIVIDPRPQRGQDKVWVNFDRNVGGWGDRIQNISVGHGWTCDIKDLKRLK